MTQKVDFILNFKKKIMTSLLSFKYNCDTIELFYCMLNIQCPNTTFY